MTKFTVVTDAKGNFLGAVQGHDLTVQQDGVKAGVSFAKGSQVHQIEADDALMKISDPAAFQQGILKYLPKR